MDEHITLVKDWDYQPKLGDKVGHHIIRENEHSRLIDFLTRRNEGSLLVCGFRGIGKTSSIFAAINEASRSRKDLVPILIKATSIHFEENEKKKSLLKRLIKSLHNNLKKDQNLPKTLDEKITNLYHKSMASEIHAERSSDSKQETETLTKSNWSLIPAIVLIVSGISFFIPILSQYSWISFGISIASGGFFAYSHVRKSTKTKADNTSQYYRLDYDFDTLQSEFEELLIDLSNSNQKILFILDEFDKFDDPLSIIQDLKMLINQGNALFVFITTPNVLPRLKSKTDIGYTLFSQVLFLKRPLFEEMESFLDEIVYEITTEIKNNSNYKHLKNYLCYQSHTNFFELYNIIRNLMFTNENRMPALSLHLDNEQITKANLQKCIGWVYNNKKQDDPSKWESNDQMLDNLYRITETLESAPKLHNITIDANSIKIPGSDVDFLGRERSIALDLFEFLSRQGYLRKSGENTYTIIGNLSQYNQNIGGIFVEEQKTFINNYDQFKVKIIHFVNMKTRWVENLGMPFTVENFEPKWDDIRNQISQYFDMNSFSDARSYYNLLKTNNPPLISTENIHRQTTTLQSIDDLLKRNSLILLSQIFAKQARLTVRVNISDISQGLFTQLGLPNRNLQNITMYFQTRDKIIDEINIVYFPPLDFLTDVKNKGFSTNNIIFCLGDEEQIIRYKDSLQMISAPTPFEDEIKYMAHLQDDEKRTTFYALELPLQIDKLEKIIQILKKIPSK